MLAHPRNIACDHFKSEDLLKTSLLSKSNWVLTKFKSSNSVYIFVTAYLLCLDPGQSDTPCVNLWPEHF